MVSSSAIFAVGLVVLSLVINHGNGLPQVQMDNNQTNTDAALQDVDSVKSCRVPGVQYPIGIGYDELLPGVLDGSLLLIDVRNASELKRFGKLEGSYNLPLPEVDQAFEMSPAEFESRYGFPRPKPEDTNVVLTCRSGRRVVVVWKKLEPLGYCKIRVYFGSYLDWKERGGRLI